MPPVHTLKNQYRGINAHLHSYWQNIGGWDSFHTLHIGHLAAALKLRLFPMGYTTDIEPSLQIRRSDSSLAEPQSDVTIYDTNPERSRRGMTPQLQSSGSVLALPLTEVVDAEDISEKPFRSVVIYQTGRSARGKPVAWVELLSPSNKENRRDRTLYDIKRLDILRSGIVFIEIDYLHESPTTLNSIGNYVRRKGKTATTDAHPYRIAVIDPRPILAEGQAFISEFNVDDPIPVVTIPLNDDDTLDFDFGIPYQQSFEAMLYGLELVDYRELPLKFDRYSAFDQARIASRMLAILIAAEQGKNLEQLTPEILPEALPLKQSLQALEPYLTK
jgi:hypothetical protein